MSTNKRQGQTAFKPQEFAEWLRTTRAARGMTKEELSERAPLARDVLTQLEQGRHMGGRVSVETFQRIARGLDLDLAYVLYKAGYDVGRDGPNMQRLQDVQDTLQLLADHHGEARLAIAEAMHALELHGEQESAAELGRALGKLDLVVERLPQPGRRK